MFVSFETTPVIRIQILIDPTFNTQGREKEGMERCLERGGDNGTGDRAQELGRRKSTIVFCLLSICTQEMHYSKYNKVKVALLVRLFFLTSSRHVLITSDT